MKINVKSALAGVGIYLLVKAGGKYLLNNTKCGQQVKAKISETKEKVMSQVNEIVEKTQERAEEIELEAELEAE